MTQIVSITDAGSQKEKAAAERQKSWMLRAWILSGLFFMALPGTLLGFSNLMAISAHHGAAGMSPAWMEGHGHAQMFGWIGSFILGIGFYSQPTRPRHTIRIPFICWTAWSTGVLMRWYANIYQFHWRPLLAISASLEAIAMLLFLAAASHHKREKSPAGQAKQRMPAWMIAVMVGTVGMTAGVLFNLVECVRLAISGATPSFPHSLDQRYLLTLGWGFVVPMVWGFSARWLPAFLGLRDVRARLFGSVLALAAAAVITGVSGYIRPATVMLALSAAIVPFSLRLTARSVRETKIRGVHSTYTVFIRIAYAWLAVASAMSIWAAFQDVHGGIWGASRHALTVGFAATMVFSIGPRILPNFCGVMRIFSTRLMLASLLLLQFGCTLRVSSEPLAYEGLLPFAWRVLPVSGMFELAGVLVFALNLGVTLVRSASPAPLTLPLQTSAI